MDVAFFLGLPIDIRKQVYFHLDGQFVDLGPDIVQGLYFADVIKLPAEPYKPSRHQQLLRKRLYSIFEPYLNIFDYVPSLVDRWLEYSLWLRYDCIVLDCMRLNHLYEGELIGPINLIYLDGRVRVSFFDKNYMLWNWYTYREYAKWIDDENDQIELTYLKLNLEYLRYDLVARILHDMQRDKVLDFVNQIQFEQEDEDDEPIEIDDQDDFETASYRIKDPTVIKVIQTMDLMKGLQRLIFRGDRLYESLVNFHGVRDNPGKTINYMAKKRIVFLQLLQAGSLCKTGVADFTRWENLRELKLVRVGEIDFNKMLLPPNCRLLTVRGAQTLYWWDVVDRIEQMVGDCYTSEVHGNVCHRTLDPKSMNIETFFQCQIIVKDSFQHLNFIKLQDIYELKGRKIVVPRSLFYNKRILMSGEIGADQIIIV
ncbi:ZYRO0G03102p [Zygosaccharomyces rouxii]|uniref:ZYRO0G03102p n=1 Tax=Zygosaccharomyces rouxii (strain ATCC 2623 / CBS 732 / NBRC 1130 / NCYC 568 / NRRL Y-229) TaxID=559307 RepID=C5DZB9_ZYGRC|nr:uncharacterized protein ZYRO0G03102g [Zygosaccharomyces rouxii]KAH9202201.1 hypothetical protein LQ764DRAFT_175086 [Zygosaccharomyces rouxii]CAR29203.1 ZYRO0G03102p [Zygosaccharomyces rouxii]